MYRQSKTRRLGVENTPHDIAGWSELVKKYPPEARVEYERSEVWIVIDELESKENYIARLREELDQTLRVRDNAARAIEDEIRRFTKKNE